MNTSTADTIRVLFHQKGISEELALQAIEESLLAAYKKHFGLDNVIAKTNKESLQVTLYAQKEVVEQVRDDASEIDLEEAQRHKANCQLEDEILIEVNPADFGHIAAQTARQVIMQRLREIEQNLIYSEYKQKLGQLISGYFRRRLGKHIFLDLGRVEAILPAHEQVEREEFTPGERIRVVITDVRNVRASADIVVSRAAPLFVQRLFEHLIPEIEDNIIQVKNIVRQAGYRTKIVVHSDSIDPVGACIGMKGMRIHNIIKELEGEKIDVIRHTDDSKEYIRNALTPAKIEKIILTDTENKRAIAVVEEEQLSLAIGKQGHNVRLAMRLTGWHIDIKTAEQLTPEDYANEPQALVEDLFSAPEEVIHAVRDIEDFSEELRELIHRSGIETLEELVEKSKEELLQIPQISEAQVEELLTWIQENVVIVDENAQEDNKIQEAEALESAELYVYSCPECNTEVKLNTERCPNCGVALDFE